MSAAETPHPPRRPARAKSRRREVAVVLFLAAVIAALLVKTFLVQIFYIEGSSMYPTVESSDRVLVEKLSDHLGPPPPGAVVVLETGFLAGEPPSGPAPSLIGRVGAAGRDLLGLPSGGSGDFIKRVVAEGGERVLARGGRVYVDGRQLPEPYLPPGTKTQPFGPVIVPQGDVFVLGDNRAGSMDSRSFGAVPDEALVGRALSIVWPPGHVHLLGG